MSEETKYCPLFTMATATAGETSPQKCMKKSCAWWVAFPLPPKFPDNGNCAIYEIADNTNRISMNS